MPASLTPGRALRAGAVLSAAVLLSACTSDAPEQGSAGASADPVAVATTAQLGSVLDDVAQCADASVETVMGPGDDPHEVAASSAQVAQMARAGLVFSNGLGLEAGMASALANAEADGARIVEVAAEVDPLPFGAGHAEHEDEAHAEDGHADHEGHDHGDLDPHFWLDAARMSQAALLMGQTLAETTGEDAFADCGDRVAAELAETDREVRGILEAVPQERRRLVVDHDAYGYFAEAYDFEVVGVVVGGGSTDGSPSSAELADLTRVLQQEQADALVSSADVAVTEVDAVAAEAGVEVVHLHEAGLGPEGSGAETYRDAMLTNARTLAEALQ